MPNIAILANAVADQIAAGEVVERPASVIKELIENSLDAGATKIEVTVEDGGRALMRVADDGSGMDRSDAVMALSRHATSKISDASELVGVRSFGFRGEALPAIASVSELGLETATEDGAGTIVRSRAGSIVETADSARRRGTTVTVQRLFFNTPARLKFMRGARTEWRGISDVVQAIGVLRRDVHFLARHDGRLMLDWPAVSSLKARLADVWGVDQIARFVSVDDVQGVIHVSGMVERPADVGKSSRRVLLMVNGRTIRDTGIVRAAEAAYRSTLPAGVRPSMVLQIRLPGSDVDVNVHPAKTEVRFRDRWPLEQAVEAAIRRALGLPDASAGFGAGFWPGRGTAGEGNVPAIAAGPALDTDVLRQMPVAAEGLFQTVTDTEHATTGVQVVDNAELPDTDSGVDFSEMSAEEAVPLVVPRLTQFRRTYLVFEQNEGMVFIDQHSAHERVLYERFMGVLERGEAPSQRLLFPMTLHLGSREVEAFESNREALTRLGFEIEHFGGHSLFVNAVPMPHPRFDAARCLRETLATLTGDRLPGVTTHHEYLAATIACKAAIKSGDELSPAEMQALYRNLAATTLPAHDVHGRATIVRIAWDELDRRFGRK